MQIQTSPADGDEHIKRNVMSRVSRRSILASGFAAVVAGFGKEAAAQVYLFSTAQCEIRMTLEFHDNYSDRGLRFREEQSDRRFCLSPEGHKALECGSSFRGAIAIAHYSIYSPGIATQSLSMRERVRRIDGSDSRPARPPFDRAIQLQCGVGSDIQAFGYERSRSGEDPRSNGPENVWCLLRQNLYLQEDEAPFLIVHWKHTLSSIRVLDMISGAGTRQLQGSKQERLTR